jgi:hypothetical protein
LGTVSVVPYKELFEYFIGQLVLLQLKLCDEPGLLVFDGQSTVVDSLGRRKVVLMIIVWSCHLEVKVGCRSFFGIAKHQ